MAIKEYDELKRELEGESKGGQRTDLYHSVVEVEGWSQSKTAEDLGISQQAVGKAIQIAEAIEEYPELAAAPSGEAILREDKRRTLPPPGPGLIHFDQARRELALATNIDEVKDIRDKAEALRQYLRQAGQGLEMQNQCAEIKIRAEVRAGELLAETVEPGRPSKRSHDATILPEGISKTQSSRWQAMAGIPEGVREQHIAEVKAEGGELTSAGLIRWAMGLKKESKRRSAQAKRKAAFCKTNPTTRALSPPSQSEV